MITTGVNDEGCFILVNGHRIDMDFNGNIKATENIFKIERLEITTNETTNMKKIEIEYWPKHNVKMTTIFEVTFKRSSDY